MKVVCFKAINADIDELTDGEGYWLNVRMLGSDAWLKGYSWSWLKGGPDIIVLSKDDEPPIYVDVEAIAAVQLSNDMVPA